MEMEMQKTERPILMSGPMVRSTIAGHKKQTRRVMDIQPPEKLQIPGYDIALCPSGGDVCAEIAIDDKNIVKGKSEGYYFWLSSPHPHEKSICHGEFFRCPYGRAGDELYVRESTEEDNDTSDSVTLSRYCADGSPVLYKEWDIFAGSIAHWLYSRKVRPSIHMERRFSRIQLRITEIRVERLRDISEEDILCEGIIKEQVIVGANCNGGVHCEETADRYFYEGCCDEGFETAHQAWESLWVSISGQESWDINPFVWVICFERIAP